MTDPERHESAVDEGLPCSAEQIKLNGGLVRGIDSDNDDLQLNCGSEAIPFFPCFFDNLGPRYKAPDSDCRWLEMTPSDRNLVLRDCDSLKTDFDEMIPSGWVLAPLDSDSLNFYCDIREKKTPHSSMRAVQDSMPEHYDCDEVSSTCKALARASSGCAEGFLKDCRFSTSSKRVCLDAADTQDYGLHGQCSAKSSTGSSASCHQIPAQCTKRTSRDLPGTEKELEDYRSPGLISNWLWPDVELRQDFKRIAPALLTSCRVDFVEIIHDMQVARSMTAERRRRFKMAMSPARPLLSRLKEVTDETLKTLQHWHFCLGLDNPACPIIASHIFWRAFRKLSPNLPETPDQVRVRVLMATAFWVAAKIVDTLRKIPRASVMASTASITARSLIHSEIPLLDALRWKLVQY